MNEDVIVDLGGAGEGSAIDPAREFLERLARKPGPAGASRRGQILELRVEAVIAEPGGIRRPLGEPTVDIALEELRERFVRGLGERGGDGGETEQQAESGQPAGGKTFQAARG